MNFFESKNALVVGGSGGIGREIALALASEGANVTVHGGHRSKRFDALMQILQAVSAARHSSMNAIVLDFTKGSLEDFNSLDESTGAFAENAAWSALKAALKTADILCLCYGPFLRKTIEETTAKEWLDMAKLNLALPAILAGYSAHFMKERGFGRILFFGGTRTSCVNGFLSNAAYGAAKTGVASLVKSFALEYGKSGVTSCAIFPGFVRTEYISSEEQAAYEKMLGAEMIAAKSVAQKALFLLSAPDMNSVLLDVDRGWQP